MNKEIIKAQLFTLFSQLNQNINKTNSIVKEINNLLRQLKSSTLNLEPEMKEINSNIESMKSKIKIHSNEFKLSETKNPIKRIDNKDLKIHIGFKNQFGEVHTFEAYYGTTIDKLLTTYLKTIGKDPYQSDLYFEYNGNNLYVGDYNKIEQIFCNAPEPTVLVKKYESVKNTNIEGIDNQLLQENYYNVTNYETQENNQFYQDNNYNYNM